MDFTKIKLIIWDLDDSFWNGTLSEGIVVPIESNIEIVKNMTNKGVVNSICSKNDKDNAENRLKEFKLNDYFVFKSIDWSPKGQRIKQILDDMGLRAINTLFIDDNEVNLNEAKFYAEGINVLNPLTLQGKETLSNLLDYSREQPFNDIGHKRLSQYRILENKCEAKAKTSDNLQFLYSTNTQVAINTDCLNELDRISELVMRTNQLNFTKNRMSKDDLKALLEDPLIQSGYVTVKDNYGDYGIVGFYALREGKAIHFLFSCRTIGQGVEQWVYSILNYPEICIQGETISKLEIVEAPKWINQNHTSLKSRTTSTKLDQSKLIIFKGPCDLEMLTSYLILDPKQVVTEFTYFSEEILGSVEHQNHTTNILNFYSLTEGERNKLQKECYFNDSKLFETKIFDKNVACVFLSTFVDPQLAIYRRKNTGYRIAFGDFDCDLTKRNNWPKILSTKFLGFQTSEEVLDKFSELYEYEGHLTADDTFINLKKIFQLLNKDAYLCLTLGSEIKNTRNKMPVFEDRELYYKELNAKIRDWAKIEKRVLLLDFNDFVNSDSDYLDSINHFQRNIYYKAAQKMNDNISMILGYELEKKNPIFLWYKKVFKPCLRNLPIIKPVINYIKAKKQK